MGNVKKFITYTLLAIIFFILLPVGMIIVLLEGNDPANSYKKI